MTFTDYTNLSQTSPVILFDIEITAKNTQWVNHGAGIWALSYSGLYDWVDSSLLSGYTVQDFGLISIVVADNIRLEEKQTLEEITSTPGTYYYDRTNKILYVCFTDYSSPYIHNIFLGSIVGLTYNAIQPINSDVYYYPRLVSVPQLGRSRDPLFFGRLAYPTANAQVINADGYFDTYAEDNNIYGNVGKIKLGYSDLDISEYKTLFSGFIETFEVSEQYASFGLTNQRKQLSKPFPYRCVNENPIAAIKAIIRGAYNIDFISDYFDITAFNDAEDYANTNGYQISIYREDDDNTFTVIELIEEICQSVWGIFDVTDDGKYTFKYIEPISTPTNYIKKEDFITEILSIQYNPQNVLSSVMVGYNRDWGDNSHTYYTDTSKESEVFAKYKTYNQQRYDTLLTSLASAEHLAGRIMDYSDTVRGEITLEVPMRYWGIEVGDTVVVKLDRPNSTMLGETFCEVLGVQYKLELPSIELTLRTINPVVFLVDHDGDYIVTDGGYYIITAEG